MLDIEQVVLEFILLTSMDKTESERWRPLCRAAAGDIARRVKEGMNLYANMKRLCEAAGALAYYRFQLIAASGEGGMKFKAGDVTVGGLTVSGIKLAAMVRDEALFAVRDLIDEGAFAFVPCGGETP